MPITTSDGRTLYLPSVDVYVEAKDLVSTTLAPGGVIFMAGPAQAGAIGTLQRMSDPGTASRVFRGGDLLDHAVQAWTNGAQMIYMMRIGSPTPATFTINDTASANCIKFTSKDKGDFVNNYKVKVESGSLSGNKVTVQFFDPASSNTTTEYIDNAANAQAVITYFNAKSILVTAASVGATGNQLINQPYAYFTGGTSGNTPSYTDWQAALTEVEKEDISWIHVPSTDSAVHGLVQTHVETMSLRRKERMGVVGAPIGTIVGDTETAGSYLNRAYNMNTERMILVAPGTDGRSSAYTAAKVVGKLASFVVSEPLTHKTLTTSSIEVRYLDQELIDLMSGGICVLEEVPVGRRVVRGVTTKQSFSQSGTISESPYTEISVVAIRDSIAKNLRGILDSTYIGKRGLRGIEGQIAGTISSTLIPMIDQGIIVSFRNIQVVRNPMNPFAFQVSVQIAPVLGINFITVNVVLTVPTT